MKLCQKRTERTDFQSHADSDLNGFFGVDCGTVAADNSHSFRGSRQGIFRQFLKQFVRGLLQAGDGLRAGNFLQNACRAVEIRLHDAERDHTALRFGAFELGKRGVVLIDVHVSILLVVVFTARARCRVNNADSLFPNSAEVSMFLQME